MFYNLMFIYNTVFCRLIVSNTLTIPNSIPIHDQTISLTVWFLFRYQIISQNQKPMPLLYITNQDKEVEVKAEFDLFTNGLSLLLNLQDQAQYKNYIYGNDYYDGWHKLQINRDGCFNRLEYEDIILHQNCSKQNDAILDICFFQCFNLYVYDTDELINEEIIISYSILKTEFVFINTDKNYLVLKFYLKFYTNIQEKTTFFALQSNTGPSLVFSSQQNIIYISLFKNSQSQEYEVVHQINILQDQWFLFSIAFNQKELLMYYYINNQINQLKILQINSLHIGTKFEIRNTEAIIFDSLQIISQLTEKFVGSCISVCQFCLSGQCYDEIKHKYLEFNISRALRDSIYFNECYFNQNQCCGDQFYLKDGSCQERQFIVSNNRPKYRGEYCIDCNISRQSIVILNNINVFSIIANTIDFTFYLKTQPKKEEYEQQQNNGLIFQDDLNIYLMKSKDIYLSYHLTGMSFCEEGYQSFEHKCIKYKKAIMQIIFDLPICKQKYGFHNKNCIICQQHCLYCELERKTLRCILFEDDYFLNDKNMIKKCTKESKINNCLTQKEAIENLEIRGYQVCQNNQMYLVEFSRCEDIAQIYSQYIYLIHFADIIQIQNQKLELQYQLEDYKNMVQDKQIRYLIYMQQLKKINKQINYYTKKQQIIRRDLLFQQLSNHNSTFEEISNKKIILQNITILLGEHIIFIFKNRVYFNINQIFEQVEDYYQMIQFDLTFDFFNVQSNQIYSFMIDFENFKNKTFIYNVRFTKNFAVLVMNKNRFIFKCNQIIFNNLTLDNDDRTDIFYNESPLFKIYSNEIIINNLIIMNKRLGNLFQIIDFKSLKIQNVLIIDSMIDILIRSSYCQYNSIIEIEEIYVTRSVLIRLIQIQAIRIQIKNIHYYGVIMESYNFYINYCQNVYLYNFYLNEVYFNQSYLIKKEDSHDIDSKIDQDTSILQNIHIKGVITKNSTFFKLMRMQNIEFKQLFINSLEFYNTQVIQINLVHNLSIEYFILKECYLFNESIILDVVSIDTIKLKNLYLHSLQLTDCGIAIFIQSDRILIQFILLDLFSLYNSNLLLFNAYKINSIKNLIFKVSNVTKSEQYLIKFSSKYFLSIENVYFIKHQLIDSNFIKILSELQIFIKNLQFIDFFIMNSILESLILIDIGKQRNIIQLFVIKAFNIHNYFRLYYLVKLNNPQKMIIYNFQLENVNNSVSLNQIVVFDNQLSSLKLKTGRIENLSDIQLVISNSNYLFIQNFIFYNILQWFNYNQMPFIQETSTIYQDPYIRISDIRMIRFEGIFIFVKGFQKINLLIDRIEFTQQLSYFQFLISENYFKGQIVWINNINITWQGFSNWTKPEVYSCLIDGKFGKLRINQVYVKNFCCQIFFITLYRDFVISNLYVDQFRSSNSILLVDDNREHDQQLSIINFTLTNSLFEQFPFLNYKSNFGRLIIQDLIIMDSKLEYFIFANHSNKKSLVLINNIILKNVESNSFLFYSLSSINYQRINLIGGKQFVIFSGHSTNITFQSGLIVDLQELCLLTRDSLITLDQSEVANSNIYVPEKKLILLNSQFLGKFSNHESISVYISLDYGHNLFKYKSLSDNVYLVQLPQNNTYLYLPSGRYIENYKYFNYVTGKYDKLYDGIFFVNLKEVEEIICRTKQVHNDKVIVERNLLLTPGITKLNNIIFTLNPLLKDQHIKYDIICNQSDQLITYRLLVKTLNCQLGEILYKDSCSQCNIDLKMYSVGYNQQYCLQMDQNTMEQLDIGQIKLFKQYWRYSYANKYIPLIKKTQS